MPRQNSWINKYVDFVETELLKVYPFFAWLILRKFYITTFCWYRARETPQKEYFFFLKTHFKQDAKVQLRNSFSCPCLQQNHHCFCDYLQKGEKIRSQRQHNVCRYYLLSVPRKDLSICTALFLAVQCFWKFFRISTDLPHGFLRAA